LNIKVRELKVIENKLTESQLKALNRAFLENKWLYNYSLSEIIKLRDNTVKQAFNKKT